MVNLARHLSEGFLLGLATGHICLATCGPVYAPFLMGRDRTLAAGFLALLELSAGRFLTYLLVGAAAGCAGTLIVDINREYFTVAAYVLLSLFLILLAVRGSHCEKGCTVARWARFADSPLLLGVATGINFCPSFLIAITRSFDLAGPVAGMAFFAAFFAGTSVFLAPIAFVAPFGRRRRLRTLARLAAVAVAAWFLGNAASTTARIVHRGVDSGATVMSVLDDTPLYVVMRDSLERSAFAVELAARRSGPVHLLSSPRDLPACCYAVLGPEFAGSATPLRAPGRLVIVMDGVPRAGAPGARAERLVSFLDRYHFRGDPRSGSGFHFKG